MNPTIYSQLDSRWSSNPYPIKSSSFGGNGCGCVACTHVAMEQTDKANWTPENLRSWMISQGFAYAGQGTTWQGITATLKYIGHSNVVCVWNDPMSEAWKELDKGNRIGIILFSKGWGGKTAGKKVYWTAGGHYIAFTDYYVKDGKHYFYMKDSGGRKNSGVFSYEDSMYGVVSKVWIVEKIGTEKKKYDGKLPSTTISVSTDRADDLATFAESMCWAYGTPEKKWKYSTGAPTSKTKTAMNKRGYNSKVNLSDCGYTQNAIIYSVLGKKVTVLGGVKESFKKVDGFNVVKDSTSISTSDVKRGDIIRYKKTNGTSQHTLMYLGNGKIAEGGRKVRFAVIRKSTKYTGKKKKVQILRAIEGTTTRTYIDRECYGGKENGKLLQAYLNFYDSTNNLVVDGIWGDCTQKAVLKMQTDFFGADEADGKIGAKTLQKMAEVER